MKNNRKLLILYIAGFALAIATAIPAYINSSFIEQFVSVQAVSWFFVGANFASFFAMLFFPVLIKKASNFLSTKLMILIHVVSLLFLVIVGAPIWLFVFFVLLWVSSQLLWINMDVFVESFTDNISTGKTRAIYFTFMNLGWILSPTIASLLVRDDSNYNLVYITSALFVLVFYLIIFSYRKKINKNVKYKDFKVNHTFVDFWKNHSLRGVYFTSFFLNLFYSSAVVYIPLYLNKVIGFEWSTLGIMFSIMLIPFVLVEIPAGIIADKYIGEKELMSAGMVIIIISLILFFLVKSANPFLWAGLLFFSRIGAALVESMRESRFFKIVDAEDVSHINFLRTSYPLGYLIGSGLGALILTFYDIQYLFLFIAILFLYSFYFIYIIEDSK